MAVASYLKDNDYKQIDFQPYQLNYEAVLKETAAKQQYWLQGVAKVQNAWTSLSELDPINKKNQETLKTFNQETKDQFTKLARTDLSLTENQEQIKNIISPLYDTTNPTSKSILFDSYLNKHYKDEFAKAELLKGKVNKDGSTFYNPSNIRALQLQSQDYYNLKDYQGKNDDDLANKMETLFKGKHSYQNYYNPMKEIQQAIKDCPANSISEQSINSQTLTTVTKKEKSASKIFDCVTSMLSPAALSQIQLDGFVRFHNDDGTKNIGALREFYVNNLDRQSKRINEEIASYQGSLARLKNDKEQSELYSQLIKNRQTQLGNIVGELKKSEDDNYILSNFNTLSGQAYKEGFLYKIAEGFSSLDYKQQVEFNEVYLLGLEQKFQRDMKVYEIQNTNQQKQLDRENAMNMTLIKEGKKNGGNDDDGVTPINLPATGKDTEFQTLASFNKQLEKSRSDANNANVSVFSYMKDVAKRDGIDVSGWSMTPKSNDNGKGYNNYNAFFKGYIQKGRLDLNADGKIDYRDIDLSTGQYRLQDETLSMLLTEQATANIRKQLVEQQHRNIQSSPEYKDIKKQQNAEIDKQLNDIYSDKSKVSKLGNYKIGSFDGTDVYVNKSAFKDLLNGKTVTLINGSTLELDKKTETTTYTTTGSLGQTVSSQPNLNPKDVIRFYNNKTKKVSYLELNATNDFKNVFNSTMAPSEFNQQINKLYEKKLTEEAQVMNVSIKNGLTEDTYHPFQKDIASVVGLKPMSIAMTTTGQGKTRFRLIKNDPEKIDTDYANNTAMNALKAAGYDPEFNPDTKEYIVKNVKGLEQYQGESDNATYLRQSLSSFKQKTGKSAEYQTQRVLTQQLGNDIVTIDLVSTGRGLYQYRLSIYEYDSKTGGQKEAGSKTYNENQANAAIDHINKLIQGTDF